MGICCSCLKGRNKTRHESESNESQPLLGNNQHEEYGSGESSDEQWLQRQQALDSIVHKAHDFFIDISTLQDIDTLESPKTGDSPLPDEIAQKLEHVELLVPNLYSLTPDEQRQLQHDIAQIPL